jgi:hypothetical protein
MIWYKPLPTSLFGFSYFSDRVLQFCPGLASNQELFNLWLLSSWDCRCALLCLVIKMFLFSGSCLLLYCFAKIWHAQDLCPIFVYLVFHNFASIWSLLHLWKIIKHTVFNFIYFFGCWEEHFLFLMLLFIKQYCLYPLHIYPWVFAFSFEAVKYVGGFWVTSFD